MPIVPGWRRCESSRSFYAAFTFAAAPPRTWNATAHRALHRAWGALTLDFIPEPDRVTPPSAATFALTMLATTAHGDAYTFAEYQRVFAKAGFVRSEFPPLPPTMQQAVVSHKG
jgi:hypothetical protein